MNFKIPIIWIAGLVITLSAAVYQRKSGPTYPYSEQFTFNGESYTLQLIRTHSTSKDACIFLPITDTCVTATIKYRLYPTKNEYTFDSFARCDGGLEFLLPKQPPAGKIEYIVSLCSPNQSKVFPTQVIRYKGDVPAYYLIPHILFMFLAMFFSNVAGLLAIFGKMQFKRIAYLTLICLFGGGIIFGPIVQKFAFGELWTGIPFGWDLTDNKTLIAFVFWVAAILLIKKKNARLSTIIAAIVMLLIFAIPHSMFGSQLNPETGKVVQGIFITGIIFSKKFRERTLIHKTGYCK